MSEDETTRLANQLGEKLNRDPANVKVLIPNKGWSEADRLGGPLYDPDMNTVFIRSLKEVLDPQIETREVNHHINDETFGRIAAEMMDAMVRKK